VNVATLDDAALAEQFGAQIAAFEVQATELAATIRGLAAQRQGG
jgi:hypothetical protein